MIKLKDLILETVSDRVLRLSKDGASKQFLRDFDKVFKKKSKELGYGKLDKKVQSRMFKFLNQQVLIKLSNMKRCKVSNLAINLMKE